MCGFAGFSDYGGDLTPQAGRWRDAVGRMARRIAHRGPDASGVHLSPHCALGHVRLAIIDPENGAQPMTALWGGREVTVAYNGEVYNAGELREELMAQGFSFKTRCDTEVVLNAYLCYGPACAEKLNGIYAFVIDDEARGQTFLCRDRFGVKPLFYSFFDGRLLFASEIKALFEYPGLTPVLDAGGVCEVFGLGPARTPGCGVFRGISELKPGHAAVFTGEGFTDRAYFRLAAEPFEDDYLGAVQKVRALLEDTVERQLTSDAPLCTFLSGGLDSSVVTALAAQRLKKRGEQLETYSFEFVDNDRNFRPSSFQPDRDEDWARRVSARLGTKHTTLYCDSEALLGSLYDGVIAKDLPGMADIDGSLTYFCREVKKRHKVALCGECADEIFGGYPWFHRREMYDGSAFPWSGDMALRCSLLKPELRAAVGLEDYVSRRLRESLAEAPMLPGESGEARRMREISWLNLRWFMATLLDRKDRCSMASGLEVRVPFADHRIAQYVYNVPWKYRFKDGRAKGLLRDAAAGLLPEEVLERKKSPYPKTYDPGYERALKKRLRHILADATQPIHKLLAEDVAEGLLNETFDYGRPWFGQLMAGPQLLAYLIQINYWLLHYGVYLAV